MALNMQDSREEFWGNSPCIDMHDRSSVASLPHHIAKPTCLETERGSCRQGNTHPVSVAQASPAAQTLDLNSEMTHEPPTRTEFSEIDLGEWHPRYLACLQHFLDQGQHSGPVQSLAAFVNIRLPCQRLSEPITNYTGSLSEYSDRGRAPELSASPVVSLRTYVQRLIVTGHDTPSILKAFFGEDWLGGVGHLCKQERVNYLFTAKSSGWAATKATYDILPDEHTPFLRPLRDATEAELREAESRWSEWLAMEDWMVGSRSPW